MPDFEMCVFEVSVARVWHPITQWADFRLSPHHDAQIRKGSESAGRKFVLVFGYLRKVAIG